MAPPALVVTVGGATSNSWATLAEAILYHSARLNASSFTGASADDQNMALLEACRELSRIGIWKGLRVNETQALSWPRDYVPDPDNPDNEGLLRNGYPALEDPFATYTYYLTTIVPVRIKEAQIELALEFLRAGTEDVAAMDADINIKRTKVDVLETEFFGQSQRVTGLMRYPRVMTLIGPLLDPAKSGMTLLRS